MTDDEFDPLPADMMRARAIRDTLHSHALPRRFGARLVWQPYMIEGGRIIDGTVYAEPIEDRAVIARIGGNVYRHEGTICRARGYTMAETDEYMASEVGHKVNDRKASRRAYLPESAFDWPAYIEAVERRYLDGRRDRMTAAILAAHDD